MTTRDANVSLFHLEVKPMAIDALQVVSLKGREQISHLFQFDLDLVSSDPDIDFTDVVNKPATLTMLRIDQEVQLRGMIADFEVGGKTADWVAYRAVFVPRIWLLTLNYQTRIFQNVSVQDIITQVLKDAGFAPKDFKFTLKGKYKPREYCVQYRETDLDFISRLMEFEGMYYFFDHGASHETLVITDDKSGSTPIDGDADIAYHTGGALEPEKDEETVSDFVCRERLVTGKVVLKDYNYRTPQVDVQGDSQLNKDMPGTYYEYGQHVKDVSDAKNLAKVRNEEIECRRRMFTGKSDCMGFHAGYKFTLEQHYRSGVDGDYVFIEVHHAGSQGGGLPTPMGGGKAPTYSNEFVCIPADVQYRPPRLTPEPKINGIMTGKVETAGGQYAFLDDEGRYRVKMPFDLGSLGSGKASKAIRLAQPYTGTGYGMHFPVLAGAEIVWACIDGDVDRPLGLGTAPNPTEKSPVGAQNKSQNVIRTASGNELVMEDKANDTCISLRTTDGHTLVLDDKDDNVEIVTTQKNVLVLDDKNKNISVQTTNGHLLIMDDSNTKIVIQSKNGHRIVIDDKTGSEKITIADKKDENRFVMDITNKKLELFTKNGSIDIQAPNGTIDIKATTLKVETKGDSTFKSANTKIEAKQDYSVKGTNIKEEATMDYKEKGMNVKSEASMEHKTKGMNVTSEAGVNMQVKGTMVTVQSSGPNTIKGMPVLIN
jgi:type VI secretion system secreted protein VgrG